MAAKIFNGYERKETDTVPDWQCPACGVAYVKASAQPAVRPSMPVAPEQSIRWRIIVPVAVLAAGVIGGAWFAFSSHIEQERRSAEAAAIAARDTAYRSDLAKVVAFTERWQSEMDLASRTSRIALSPRVAALQELRRQWETVTFDSNCITAVKPIYKEGRCPERCGSSPWCTGCKT